MNKLTKSDFIHYLNCSKSLWLAKHDEENYPAGEFSVFMKKLISEGYEVERFVQQYFTDYLGKAVDFQSVFQTDTGLFARADIIESFPDGKCFLYEVKSSTSVKTDAKHNHIKDACFQKITAERSGQNIDKVFIIHLNGGYVRRGDVDLENLLVIEDVSDQVASIYLETEKEIDNAITLLGTDKIDLNGCDCKLKSRGNHCDSFEYFNPDVPSPSIYSLARLSEKKRRELIANNIYDLQDVPADYELSEIQSIILKAAQSDEPQIDIKALEDTLAAYQYPLYFFDYETFSSAVPIVEGSSPHKHIPVQYSLHILNSDGQLDHKEFLQREARLPRNLVEQMELDFGSMGSIVSWHASFEKTQNKEMAKWFPDKADFLNDLNDRMVDLEDIFKKSYVDAKFDGSTSIKKVLPVLCPHLGYDDLAVQDGASAMDAWQQMVNASGDKSEARAKELLAYCKLDTFAMVEIYNFLKNVLGD